MSMAAKSSDLVDKIYGANLQMEGYVDMPSQSAKDAQELESIEQFSLSLAILVPSQKATIQSP